jgi:hypothetical protein
LKFLLQAMSVSNHSGGFVIDVQNQLFTRLSNSMIQLARPLSRWQDEGDHFAVLDVHGFFT